MINNDVVDVKILKQKNYANDDTWFELFEIESGEVLCSGTETECEEFYEKLDHDDYELLND